MLNKEYNVIGVMSGTSLDGIDLVSITFNLQKKWKFKIHFAETILYSNYWFDVLKGLNFKKIKCIKFDTVYLHHVCLKIIKLFVS